MSRRRERSVDNGEERKEVTGLCVSLCSTGLFCLDDDISEEDVESLSTFRSFGSKDDVVSVDESAALFSSSSLLDSICGIATTGLILRRLAFGADSRFD